MVLHTQTEILERLRSFSASQISDALGFSRPVETGFRPPHPMFRICGRALTVLCEPDDNLAMLHALDEAKKGTLWSSRVPSRVARLFRANR